VQFAQILRHAAGKTGMASAHRCAEGAVVVPADRSSDPLLPKGLGAAGGPVLFSGCWNKPEQTREEFTADGFFKTGDLRRVDDKGYMSITGRAKDLIISGGYGYNVYPAEVEEELREKDVV